MERIEQELAALSRSVQTLAGELQRAYRDYLRSLSPTLRQQLFLMTYQVCTQGYPKQFLGLSLGQRQTLQAQLRDLAHHSQTHLLDLVADPDRLPDPPDCPVDPVPVPDPDHSTPASDPAIALGDSTLDFPAALALAPPPRSPQDLQPLTVHTLIRWQQAIETAIAQELHSLCIKTNHLLQQSGILPNKLPEFFKATDNIDTEQMEAISQNILEMLADVQNSADLSDDDEESEVGFSKPQFTITMRLMTVHLKLTDIEFSDNTTSSLRTRLRSLISRLKKLQQDSRKKERDLAIAQAEVAWRSTWFDP